MNIPSNGRLTAVLILALSMSSLCVLFAYSKSEASTNPTFTEAVKVKAQELLETTSHESGKTERVAFSKTIPLATTTAFGEYRGPVAGPLAENDGYYARFTGESFKYMNWNTARLYAEGLFIRRNGKIYKGFLATPNTVTENAFMKSRLVPNEDWIGLFQAPRPRSPQSNWWFLNNRTLSWNGWGNREPDDQKNGGFTRCSILSFFNNVTLTFTSQGDGGSFGVGGNPDSDSTNRDFAETGCENCGMMRADGKWKDKECNSHGNGFLVEFRNL